ncbi:MAG: nucleotide-binding protein [Candidatus Marinimicrobia bacterium]|nr:nucleotide-binding protein [Candidatus Neomarinimicrobiota bacterium]
MLYHIRISQKSNKKRGEVKVDLTEEQLKDRYVKLYEEGMPLFINGKTIPIDDIERIEISRSDLASKDLINHIKAEDAQSSFVFLGGPSYEWSAADRAEDVTEEYITGPPGSKRITNPTEEIIQTSMLKSEKKVFVVHGHDQELKNDVEVFLKNIGLEPIVLHREVDEGLTLIEKFERHSDVGYALILITPDDEAFPKSELKKSENKLKIELRARQNVIFEWGYFVGKIGRSNVCCVYKEGVTLPSDMAGLVYKKVTKTIEEIGYELIKELNNAGFKLEI